MERSHSVPLMDIVEDVQKAAEDDARIDAEVQIAFAADKYGQDDLCELVLRGQVLSPHLWGWIWNTEEGRSA